MLDYTHNGVLSTKLQSHVHALLSASMAHPSLCNDFNESPIAVTQYTNNLVVVQFNELVETPRITPLQLMALNDTSWAHGVVVSHPLSMREALGSIPSVSIY